MQTTPPCAEGLRWIVLEEPLPISVETVAKMQDWLVNVEYSGSNSNVLTDNRLPLPLNGRTIFYASGSGGSGGGGGSSGGGGAPAPADTEAGGGAAPKLLARGAAAVLGVCALAALAL